MDGAILYDLQDEVEIRYNRNFRAVLEFLAHKNNYVTVYQPAYGDCIFKRMKQLH